MHQLGDIEHRVVKFPPPRDVQESARLQAIPLSSLIKTIVVRRGEGDFVFVLVPGDRVIDWPKLRRHLGVSRLSLPDRETAKRVTGYEPGTITPFGSSTGWPVVCDTRLIDLDPVAIGGGARGVTIHLSGRTLATHLSASLGDVTRPNAVSCR
jgi:Cys-tRNA(Pro)/Cys-tRNA(Cys) deacylase